MKATIALFGWILLVALSSRVSADQQKLDLSSKTWTLTNSNGSIEIDSKPGYALEALRQKKIIQDPLYRYGELNTRWVAFETWRWQLAFNVPVALLERNSVFLRLTGIDTFGTIRINGAKVLNTDNFHRWVVRGSICRWHAVRIA